MGENIKILEKQLLEAVDYLQKEINKKTDTAECTGVFVKYNPKDPKEFDIVIRIRQK